MASADRAGSRYSLSSTLSIPYLQHHVTASSWVRMGAAEALQGSSSPAGWDPSPQPLQGLVNFMLQNEEAQALSGSILERKDHWSLPLYDKIGKVLLLDETGRSRLS